MEEIKYNMELTVGAILEGKVKSITNFGAFVSLDENRVGMVHISEVANAYVSDIREHLTEGQDVKVMVIGNENGKINLSIKRLEPRPQRTAGPRSNGPHTGAPRRDGEDRGNSGSYHGNSGSYHRNNDRNGESFHGNSGSFRGGNRSGNSGSYHRDRPAQVQAAAPKTADQLFEEKLKAFMSESDSKISSIKQYSDHRTKGSRRR